MTNNDMSITIIGLLHTNAIVLNLMLFSQVLIAGAVFIIAWQLRKWWPPTPEDD